MKIVTLWNDQDAENPLEYDGWTVHSFNRRHGSFVDPDKFFRPGKDGKMIPALWLRRKLEVGTAFILSCYEHGGVQWSLRGEGIQDQWDTAQVAGLLIWEQPVKNLGPKTYQARAQDARHTIELYTNWCNGSVFGYNIEEEVTLPCGHKEIHDFGDGFHGGFYDTKEMIETIKAEVGDDQVKVTGDAAWIANRGDFNQSDKTSGKDAH